MLMDLPPASARYDILRSCIFELMDKKLVQNRCREGILNLISIQHFIKHILQVINDEFRPMMKLSDELNISSITDSSTLSGFLLIVIIIIRFTKHYLNRCFHFITNCSNGKSLSTSLSHSSSNRCKLKFLLTH
jgi:hypothetical protein